MSLHVITLEEKLAVIDAVLDDLRPKARADRRLMALYEPLQAIAADLRGRQELPRSQALGELHRALERMKASKTSLGNYDQARLAEVANVVVRKWPTIQQALEQFGEESAE